ncbi:MAG: hypothetical protein KatS3mg119_1762 [Rhodothalassiaceae bacterium]|nr:MAG: hypothetical protein KatS3mg119_1762 [Rhodothalassiaceae bacterium]
MARRFIYAIAGLVFALIATLAVVKIYWDEIQWMALQRTKITVPYDALPVPPPPDYAEAAAWAALPELEDPADALPEGVPAADAGVPVFFIHPTTYFGTGHWNAPLDDPQAAFIRGNVLKALATAFTSAGPVHAPKYRQAAFGAFLAANADSFRALDLAYRDVAAAFDAFLARIGGDAPFVIAGHSQGALLGLRLVAERLADPALRSRLVAAWLVGWPIGVAEDLGAVAIPPCSEPEDTGCVLSWQSFGQGGDPEMVVEAMRKVPGLSGRSRAGDRMLCVNPVTGRMNGAPAPRAAHRGAILIPPRPDAPLAAPIPNLVAARCGEPGVLWLDPAPEGDFAQFRMPGLNYHVWDIPLFWMDVRADVARRTAAWRRSHGTGGEPVAGGG